MPATLPKVDGFEVRLHDYAAKVDREMAEVIEEQVDDEWMRGAIQYHLGWADTDFRPLDGARAGSGGKKLRPGLALFCYQGAGDGALEDAVPFAAALELLHNFSLVHDDVQDRDRLRRGRPTLWTICGEAQAINVGNCMHMLAFGSLDRLRERGVAGPQVAELVATLARTSIRVTVGQKRDIAFETQFDVTPEMYLEMIGGKTAALTRCATYGGALLGLGGPGPRLDAFSEYGWLLGLGFQIRDDILGIWGSEELTGKSAANDIRRRKKSLPIVFAFREAEPEARARLRDIYAASAELTPDEEAYVRLVLEDCHAETYAQDQAEQYRRRAATALSEAAGGEGGLDANPFLLDLRQLGEFVTARAS